MISKDMEIGWIAGFLDGDGCFGWYGEKRNSTRRQRKQWVGYPSVIASQNFLEPLERISKTFPGTVRYITTHKNGNKQYEYRVNNKIAIDIMVAVYPIISSRRQEKIQEIIANYASREAERLEDSIFCPKGHSRDEHGFIVKSGANKGNRRCKLCDKEWTKIHKDRQIIKELKKFGIAV